MRNIALNVGRSFGDEGEIVAALLAVFLVRDFDAAIRVTLWAADFIFSHSVSASSASSSAALICSCE
jgi:hypothetical protein